MTALNGGLPKRANESMPDFVAEFIDHITPTEWRIIAQLPNLKHVTELVAVVLFFRSLPTPEVPPGHPLAAAAAS